MTKIERVDKTVLCTVYRMMRNGTVYDEAWDETAEELLSTPSCGDESDTFENCE